MQKINIGIIGLGAIGERLIKTFIKHPRTNIIGVFDVDVNRMDLISSKFNLTSFSKYEDLVNDKYIDMIYVAVPPKYHRDITLKVIAANKHVLCEKPLASTIDEARDMLEAATSKGVVHGMNFPLYYGYAYNKIKSLLSNNKLGEIKRIELNAIFPVWPRLWQQNNWIDTKEEGGFVREVFTHFIQLIQDSFGNINNIKSFAEYSSDSKKSEIEIIARGELSNNINVLFNGITGLSHEEDLRLIIHGTNGTAEILNWRDLYLTFDNKKNLLNHEPIDSTYELIDAFYKAIDGTENNLVTFDAGLNTTITVENLLK